MKVLYVFPNAKLAGAEQVTRLMIFHHSKKWEPQAYFLTDGPLVCEFRESGIKTHVFSGERPRLKKPWTMLRAISEISRVIKNEGISLVHSVMGYGHLFGGLAAIRAGVPNTWFQHGPAGALDWMTGRIPTQVLFVNSRYTQGQEERFRPMAKKITVLYPGAEELELKTFLSESDSIRTRYDIRPDNVLIGLIGRISPMKGHELFIKAAAQVAKNHPQAKFLMVGGAFMPGDSEYEMRSKELARSLGLEGRLFWTGPMSPPYSAMAACDVIVNSSTIPEPFGLTLIEGMMLGRPVIAPQAGGPLEIIDPSPSGDGDGLLFEMNRAESLAEQMGVLLSSEALRKRLGENARKAALEHFTAERMVEELELEYDRVIT